MALTDKLTAIGNAIREKTGKSALLSLDEMPVEIRAIETGGGSGGEGGDSSTFEDRYFSNNSQQFADYGTYTNDRLTSIRPYAFAGSQYTTYNLPNLTSIGEGAFYKLPGKNEGAPDVKIIAPKITELPNSCFQYCYNGIILDAPNVKKFGSQCFANTNTLFNKSFEFYYEGVEELVSNCFEGCGYYKINLPNVITAGRSCFSSCYSIYEINLPNLTTAEDYCFEQCKASVINLPNLTTIGEYLFSYTEVLELNLPSLSEIKRSFLRQNTVIRKVDFGESCQAFNLSSTSSSAAPFYNCSSLEAVIFRSNTLISLPTTNVFYNSSIAKGTGYIYVPAALVENYKVAANWATYANQIRAIEDYPEICGEA